MIYAMITNSEGVAFTHSIYRDSEYDHAKQWLLHESVGEGYHKELCTEGEAVELVGSEQLSSDLFNWKKFIWREA